MSTDEAFEESIDFVINEFLSEALHDSGNIKKINIYTQENSLFYKGETFFSEATDNLKPGEYAFFYRNDGNGGWKNEHLLLKLCERTFKLGTVFAEGSQVSSVIDDIASQTNYEVIQDSNLRY